MPLKFVLMDSLFTHVVYVDDSGNKEYLPDPEGYGKGVSRHFVFGGILLTTDEAGRLTSDMMALKLKYFGEDDVEIKSNWLRQNKERHKRYIDPYSNMTPDLLEDFVDKFYELICSAEVTLIASCVDKAEVQRNYRTPFPAVQLAYDCFLHRVQEALPINGNTSIIIDDMTGAQPGQSPHKELLRTRHEELKRSGSPLFPGFVFNKVKGPVKFKNSSLSSIIQASDLVAYNVYRELRDRSCGLANPEAPFPSYSSLKRICHKFQGGEDEIIPLGIVRFPMTLQERNLIIGPKEKQAAP